MKTLKKLRTFLETELEKEVVPAATDVFESDIRYSWWIKNLNLQISLGAVSTISSMVK
ncbi:hypothetical protein GCM10020331_006020 [Ectobacillus funiculus]